MQSYDSLAAVQAAIHSGAITLGHLVNTYLERIQATTNLNAFVEVFGDEAIEYARIIDKKIKDGKAGKLAGMVIGIKDNICYKDHQVTASSKILQGFTSIYSSTVVERLLAEDAIIIGRLNCDEFAMGGSNETSVYGPVLNAADHTKISGGSSGGSAVAVQADLCLAALGTDTGGSVRQPASFCGVIGLKPTYGRVSRHGIIAYASSFDQVGPITKSIEDAALLLEVMAGKDDYDSTASSVPVANYSGNLEFKGKARIAYLSEALNSEGLDPEIKASMQQNIDKLRAEGHVVEEAHFPYLDYVVPTYYILTTAEASSNLARYDGVHYGYRSDKAVDLETTYKKSRSEGFGLEVKRRIMLGTFVLSAGYYDAYYAKAQKVRRLIQDNLNQILSQYDFILLPNAPTTAWTLGEKIKDPVVMYLEDIFTVQASLAGLPAISVPVAEHSNGLPIGMQLIGKKFDEGNLLSFSKTLLNINKKA
ncbi:Asp-tRNA(Asn)/Glu-tRNA(Gln) amidotransferase subunit GatA [Solitalea canadensis]|uniref:Glutamyl-tRNA(Gln) amidotransferase subunit A n=1 Tax=Solitalea canadensis (strain ATCC 29591 / DSM 3403 / JCM 21819 / LMG 8368 / NBRC 15130 / NCIMB 12057 / USAM 9D) TaxID=929556 RepID=H8KMT2_SOLCM|nr:Asp-tRNA(Asn)/Glu-tRNA(Gln) amidotransferase subunit GatA [Solitalea canadensis]AFD09335.1 glutamyl-tRNA(Gln) and/or aspartyl-tRNA(Asn) amidotransferase, A subunit [Solitalea canadensis DSM 3403]